MVESCRNPHAGSRVPRRAMLGAASLATLALATSARAQSNPAAAMPERFAQALSAHDMTAFAALFADDYVNHQMSAAAPPPTAGSGKTMKQGTVDFFAARLAGMPDLSVATETALASGDRVAASFVYTGTHGGTLMGVAPTGRALRFTSCDIFAVRDGQFVAHWGMGDIAGVLAQLRS